MLFQVPEQDMITNCKLSIRRVESLVGILLHLFLTPVVIVSGNYVKLLIWLSWAILFCMGRLNMRLAGATPVAVCRLVRKSRRN